MTGIEDLKEKREILNKRIAKEEDEKASVQNEIRVLSEKLSHINESLAKKMTARSEYDKTIGETEAAYSKVSDVIAGKTCGWLVLLTVTFCV